MAYLAMAVCLSLLLALLLAHAASTRNADEIEPSELGDFDEVDR